MDKHHFLRLSFTYAMEARELGDGPFGAIVLDEQHEIIARAGNTTNSDHSVTYHAEMNAVQQAEYKRGKGKLNGCILVSSAEPCAMCASAIAWSGISKVIYGVSIPQLKKQGLQQINISCREVLAKAPQAVSVEGPLLEEEGLEVFK